MNSLGVMPDAQSYALLAGSYRALEDDKKALAVLEEGLRAVGDDPELHFACGQVLTSLGRLEGALDHYDRTLGADVSGHFSSVDTGILGFKTLHNSAGVLAELGRYSEAKDRFVKALEQAPTFLQSAFALFDLALRKSDFETAAFCLDHVRSQEGVSRNWCEMARKRGDAIGGPMLSLTLLDAAVREYPSSVDARIALSRAYFDCGRLGEALAVLAPLVEHGIAEAAFLSSVCYLQAGDIVAARAMTVRALQLNPGHPQTVDQLRKLNVSIGLPEDEDVV